MSDLKPEQLPTPPPDERSKKTPPGEAPQPEDDPFIPDLELIGEQVRHYDPDDEDDEP